MNVLTLSQLQFAATTVYHFFFVPLTLGLSVLVAIMETLYVVKGDETYRRMTRFWGKLFLINFAMGVVTGIVMEFQFGMNWANYARFVGDIFGAPLAIEALLAFFLESTFLGLWIFGWDKISKKFHAATIWLVAIGSNLSALWILIANSFMQHPVGYEIQGARAVMTDFGALVSNPYVWHQFPHTVLGGFTTGAFFILGISAYHLVRKHQEEFFQRSFKLAAIFGTAAILLTILVGDAQTKYMVKTQPMKIAAAEALWRSENPASFSLLTIADEEAQEDIFSLRIPSVLSFLAYNQFGGEVKGMRDLQQEYEARFGPGDYIPSVFIAYWAFRAMVGAGMLMLLLAAYALLVAFKKNPFAIKKLLPLFPVFIALPYLSNTTGWILTETGRQPWAVFGVLKTVDAVSPNISVGMVLTSLIVFILLYGVLMAADIYLLVKTAKAGPLQPVQETANELKSAEAFWG
ncbi:MAG: cytochrome ubiquinol oxidase subunit I [Leptolinea sp.]|jgi:cytochrome d ubiquinol oxidase subunit I|nr:cytochrome ubiquinol oxidase subunit I [Leptolinea sp.]